MYVCAFVCGAQAHLSCVFGSSYARQREDIDIDNSEKKFKRSFVYYVLNCERWKREITPRLQQIKEMRYVLNIFFSVLLHTFSRSHL